MNKGIKDKSQDLPTRLREETEQITCEFDGKAAKEIVDRCVSEAQSRIADARVTDYAPIFFGRHARRLIREATANGATRPPLTA
jgi:hypothetical protein